MIKTILLFRLLALILRTGKFRHSGYEYGKARHLMMRDMKLQNPRHDENPEEKTRAGANAFVRMWVAQASLLKQGMKRKGGHVCAPALKLCYIRIPKSASSALSFALLQAKYDALKVQELSGEKINFLADVNLLHETSDRDDATFFTVVRNPFARIVSVYRAFFEQESENFIYEDYLFGILRKDFSFREFVNTLQLIPDLLKDQHLKPQDTFLQYYRRKNIPVKTLKLEEPEALESFLSHYDLTLEKINNSVASYDYRDYYDKETAGVVGRLYSADIARFGYEAACRELTVFRVIL